jgi:hypothetical protein
VENVGFTVIDAGELKTARLLEPYGMLWIHLALTQKVPGDFAFALSENKIRQTIRRLQDASSPNMRGPALPRSS